MSGPHEPLPDALARAVAERQRTWRSASVAAGLVRAGEPLWTGGAGRPDVTSADLPTPDTQYRIGSITKTFTAVLVMQCRDDHLLDLDDPLHRFLPDARHGGVTVRRMLSHLSGLQREPVGDVWEQPEGPGIDALLSGLVEADPVLPAGRRWHYSNLAFATLGEVVARLRRTTWEQALSERVLAPLDLRRTTLRREPPHAVGYLTDPYADRVHEEPEFPGNAFAPAAELWSTTTDLTRWGSFLADPDSSVLHPDTLEEMCHPQVMPDLDGWTLGWGLGLMLYRRGDRVLVGHSGNMPGFSSGLAVWRKDVVVAAAFANSTSGADCSGLAGDLVELVLDTAPPMPEPWVPGPPVPPELEQLVGEWWSEGSRYTFSVREGRLEARHSEAPAHHPPAVFVPEDEDRYRTVSGREHGELLRVDRRPDGSVERMYWATYPVTREPRTFGS